MPGSRVLYQERRGPFTRLRVDEETLRFARTRVPVDAITVLEPVAGAVRVRAAGVDYAIQTRSPHFLLAALREATAHDAPTEEQLAAARAIREAPEPPDPVLYTEPQLSRLRTIRVCERTLRVSRRPPIRLEWIEQIRVLDLAQVEAARAEGDRMIDAIVALDKAGQLGMRQLDTLGARGREAGTPDPNGFLWGRGMKGGVYMEVEAGAAPVYFWLIGSRHPERLYRELSGAIDRRKAAVTASGTATA